MLCIQSVHSPVETVNKMTTVVQLKMQLMYSLRWTENPS